MLSIAGASDCAGTFTAADVHRIQTAFSDSLLVVEKDGIMQVCSHISAFYYYYYFCMSFLQCLGQVATISQQKLHNKLTQLEVVVSCCRSRTGKQLHCFASNGV